MCDSSPLPSKLFIVRASDHTRYEQRCDINKNFQRIELRNSDSLSDASFSKSIFNISAAQAKFLVTPMIISRENQ